MDFERSMVIMLPVFSSSVTFLETYLFFSLLYIEPKPSYDGPCHVELLLSAYSFVIFLILWFILEFVSLEYVLQLAS